MKRPMVRSMRSSMRKSMVNPGGGGAEQRIFIELDDVLMSHYLLATPINLTGSLALDYAISVTATEMDFANGYRITAGGIF